MHAMGACIAFALPAQGNKSAKARAPTSSSSAVISIHFIRSVGCWWMHAGLWSIRIRYDAAYCPACSCSHDLAWVGRAGQQVQLMQAWACWPFAERPAAVLRRTSFRLVPLPIPPAPALFDPVRWCHGWWPLPQCWRSAESSGGVLGIIASEQRKCLHQPQAATLDSQTNPSSSSSCMMWRRSHSVLAAFAFVTTTLLPVR
jgi:hypothetical protein